MDNIERSLMYFNLYKIDCHFQNITKPLIFEIFDRLILREEYEIQHYDIKLRYIESQISDESIKYFAAKHDVSESESKENQIIMSYIAIRNSKLSNTIERSRLYEDMCCLESSWDNVATEENHYIMSEGYQPVPIDEFQRSYGYYELSSGNVLVADC